jgi:ATP:corrinoid adenosyltransferase
VFELSATTKRRGIIVFFGPGNGKTRAAMGLNAFRVTAGNRGHAAAVLKCPV